MRIVVLFILLLLASPLFAQQQLSNLRVKKVVPNSLPIILDALTIIPNSIEVLNFNNSQFTFNNNTQLFKWLGKNSIDTITILYRIYPFNISTVKQINSYDTVMQRFKMAPINNTPINTSLFDWGSVTYGGTIGRGLSFGNSQSAVLNSNLNLTLQGYLADSIAIKAQISDNNLPIQPDGSTQQLNEFDRILVQFSKNNWAIDAGDIDLRETENNFLRFGKRVQGIGIQYKQQLTKKIDHNFFVTGSITKGRYFRHAITPQEGNQGPYKLRGANNEAYFVVIANSERIYIDGQLLTRGLENDYTIDYNTAEILFTNSKLISKDLRINVEFEYADRNYVNALFYFKDDINIGKKLKLQVQHYTNGDNKNGTLNQNLSPQQKQFLFNLGDSIQDAFYPIAGLDTLVGNKILYAKRDTIVGGFSDSVYSYSTNPNFAKYNLNFIDVGEGKGNYLPNYNGVNGRIFYWLAPINGKKQGRFEPVLLLITPKKIEVTSVQAQYKITNFSNIQIKIARSKNNSNLFSNKNKADDTDWANEIQHNTTVKINGKQKLLLNIQTELQFVGKNFNTVERIRNIEFNRDWALPIIVKPSSEQLLGTNLKFVNNINNTLEINLLNYKRSNDYNGLRFLLAQQYINKTWQLNQNIKLTQATGYNQKGYFFRPTINLTKTFKKAFFTNWASEILVEHNAFKNSIADTFDAQSFAFREYRTTLKTDIKKPNLFSIGYYYRGNYFSTPNNMPLTDRSNNIKIDAAITKNNFRQVFVSATFRNVKVFSKSFNYNTLGNANTLLSAIRYQFKEFKNIVVGNINYETGSGQEQRRDFAYIAVPLGQGSYYWIDYNADGIKQLNEFEPAVFPDQKQYLKLYTATNEYIKANFASVGYQINIEGNNIKYKKTQNFLKQISKFTLSSFTNFNKKALAANNKIDFNPLINNQNINNVISYAGNQGHTLYFNKLSNIYGADVNFSKFISRNLLSYGLEAYTQQSKSFKTRYAFNRNVLMRLLLKQTTQSLVTPAFINRNYLIIGQQISPEVNYTFKNIWSINTQLKLENKRNQFGAGQEKLKAISAILDGRYALKNSGFIGSKLTFNYINYTGLVGSTTSFIMLEALQPGRNLLLTLDYTKKLKNGLELQVAYNGRKVGNSKMIHTGTTGIVAAF